MNCPRSSYNSLINCGSNEIAGVHCQGKILTYFKFIIVLKLHILHYS